MRYLLLLKRLIKKKSYIAMLLVVPLMVLMLNAVSSADAGLLTIGIYLPGDDYSSDYLLKDLADNPGNLRFIFYDNEDSLREDVARQQLTEGWIFPEDLDTAMEQAALKGKPKQQIEIIIREDGLTHMLAKEVLCSRVYPLVARQKAIDYVSKNVYNGAPTQEQSSHILETFDTYGINGNLFQMGYLDGVDSDSETEDSSYLMMPLRGILALWLMLLSIAASMYYLEDQSNGLFIWWKTPFGLARDFAYYVVIMLIPSIMVLIGLWYGGVFTSFGRELLAILVYDCVLIVMASIFREIIGSIKGLGIITPILIMSSALLSPVFIDLKEGRSLQRICPTFHYLYCIHDLYYVKILSIYGLLMVLTWYIIHIVLKNTKLL